MITGNNNYVVTMIRLEKYFPKDCNKKLLNTNSSYKMYKTSANRCKPSITIDVNANRKSMIHLSITVSI